MTAGTAFRAVGEALVDALAARPGMAGWNVRYSSPREPKDLQGPSGAQLAVWVDPEEGGSTYEVVTSPMGYEETGTVALVFQHGVEKGPAAQEDVDGTVDEAVGELLDLLTDDPHLADHPLPAGWDLAWARLAGTDRTGGLLGGGGPGRFRVVVVDVAYTANRC